MSNQGHVESVCSGFCGHISAGIGITMKAVYTEKMTYSVYR